MALPPLWLPPTGSWTPPAPQMFHTFVLPQTFYPQGSAILLPVSGQEQSFPAAWAPPVGAAPWAPQAPPPGLQMAPCGSCFDPRFFHVKRTIAKQPPPATPTLAHGPAAPPGPALWGLGGCETLPAWAAPGILQGPPTQPPLTQLPSFSYQGRAVAAAPPALLLTSIPGLQHIRGPSGWSQISSTATPTGAPLGSHGTQQSHVPPRPLAAPQKPAPGDPAGTVDVTEEMLLQEAFRLFASSTDTVGSSQDSATTISRPGDPGATRGEGRAVAPAHTTLPNSIPGHKNSLEWSSETKSSSTATPEERSPDSNIPASSDLSSDTDLSLDSIISLDTSVPTSPSAVHQCQALGDLKGPQEFPLEEALRLFDCSGEVGGVSQDSPGSSPRPTEPGDTCTAISPSDFDAVELPEELLSHNYTLEETMEAVRFLEKLLNGPESQELWEDVGTELPPAMPAQMERQGTKQGTSSP
ncbi:PREDICTED: proline-rich protein 36-like [Calidris pugnax]|uniref:proline-rich protein 36-like n=1 Tax=Calidris pugnax TaxID=198806 RepID=UPI00071E373D|nr:PREDICTED: proline-rich protein 36-like [Calidris pugnax]XP_014817771.1 PREDICTED: proline-rich protein 36-like [Calidris pugnax]